MKGLPALKLVGGKVRMTKKWKWWMIYKSSFFFSNLFLHAFFCRIFCWIRKEDGWMDGWMDHGSIDRILCAVTC
jgi:hypothetical protein